MTMAVVLCVVANLCECQYRTDYSVTTYQVEGVSPCDQCHAWYLVMAKF